MNWGTASRAFESLAGGVLGATDNFGPAFGAERCFSLNSSGSPPSLWWVTDCWFCNSAYGWYRCANTVINIHTAIRIEIDFIPSVQRVLSIVDLFEDFESHTSDYQYLLLFDGTADVFNCITALRNSRTICWRSDVLDACDSRSVRFLDN